MVVESDMSLYTMSLYPKFAVLTLDCTVNFGVVTRSKLFTTRMACQCRGHKGCSAVCTRGRDFFCFSRPAASVVWDGDGEEKTV